MDLSDYEKAVFAYYVDNKASELNMVPRFWAYAELVLLIEDKVRLAVRKFGAQARKASANAARVYLDFLLEKEGFSTVQNEYGGTMHRYQPQQYADCIKELQETDPIIRQAREVGPDYWEGVLK